MVGGMATEMGNADNEEAAIVKLLEKGGESHMKGWNLDLITCGCHSDSISDVGCCVICCMSRNKDTTTRYSQLGKKLKNMPDLRDAMDPGLILFISCTFLHFYPDFSDTRVSKDLMEHRFGRESVLDGITSLRSLMSKLLACAHAPAPLFQIFNFLGYLINWDGPPKSL